MKNIGGLSPSDRKKLIYAILCLAGSLMLIIMGVNTMLHSREAMETISGLLGLCSLAAAVVTAAARIMKAGSVKEISLDFLLWIFLAILLFNTNILRGLGSIAFIIIGVGLILKGIRNFAFMKQTESGSPVTKLFGIIPMVIGVLVIINSGLLFEKLFVLAIGLFLTGYGISLGYEGIGRIRYFRNFRGLDD
ncbi:MAG: hypothetical protein ACI4Q6_07975 [Huintestinicola sp.]